MPVSLDDFLKGSSSTPSTPAPSSSTGTPVSLDDFMNKNSAQGPTNANMLAPQPDSSQSPFSTAQNWQQNMQSAPQPQQQPIAPSSGGFFSNLMNRYAYNDGISNMIHDSIKGAGNVLNSVGGAMKGVINAFPASHHFNDGTVDPAGHNHLPTFGHLFDSIKNGFMNPDQSNQDFTKQMAKENAGKPAWATAANNFVASAGTDPLSYVPIGPIAKALGTGVKAASDFAGATPYIAKALNATANAPVIKPSIQFGKDTLGKMFTPNYGASPGMVDALKAGKGADTVNHYSIAKAIGELAQNSKGTPELGQTGHMVEKTFSGPLTPEQHSYISQFENLRDNGPQHSAIPIGTKPWASTASAVSGEPLLQNVRDNYFKHMYDNMTPAQKKMFPTQQEGVPGLSSNGPFNMARTFQTLQDAKDAGLKPNMDPFQILATHLSQSSKSLVNNQTIATIKNTPGLLFDKDPIDEVRKLMITGRMTEDQAAAHLGMSLDDMKKGFVKSQVPQLSGSYIRPADEAALVEHLNPSKPTGVFKALGAGNDLYNKGFLLNPAPHLHNVYENGVGLGGAKPSYIKEAYDNIKNGVHDPNYVSAMQSGAISNPVGGKFSDVIDRLVNPTKNPLMMAKNASHDLLWNNDSAIRTALHRQGMESGMSAPEAAAHTNKFMVDYQNLTPFEKQYVKPIINFYAWKKGNIPLQASQSLMQSPKYAIRGHALDSISQALSGNPADAKGRIDPNQQLPDGSHTMIDPYDPMGELNKIKDKGIIPWLYNSINPVAKTGIDLGTSLAQAAGLPIQNKFPIFNRDAPLGHNLASGAAHVANALNPLNSSAVLSGAGVDQSNLINGLFGQKTKDNPSTTPTEAITKVLGGFTGRVNPTKDARNAAFQQRDSILNHIKYEKSVGIPVSKAEKRAAYRKIR